MTGDRDSFRLIPVGFLEEYEGLDIDPIPVDEHPRDPSLAADERRAIASYLRGGRCMLAAGDLAVADLLEPEETTGAGRSVYSDGTHVWPGYLAHYVERHGFAIPPALVALAIAGPPALIEDDQWSRACEALKDQSPYL